MSEEIDALVTAQSGMANDGMMVKSPEQIQIKTGGVHRFLPGNPGGPGRKKKDKLAIEAFTRRLPPEELADYLIWGLEKAKEQNSPKTILAYAELYYAYIDGKPVQTIRQEESGLDWILAKLNGE